MSKPVKFILFVVLTAGLFWMLSDSFFQPGVKDIEGDLKELAFVRNEQNTGPIVRIYTVSVKDTLWNSMNSYGSYMPHTKLGVTRVYYFREGTTYPPASEISLTGDNIPDKYQANCIARYEKNMMGKVLLTPYPFRNNNNGIKK